MEKEQLRIGNWVYSQEIGENVQISSINDEYVTFKDYVTWDYPNYDEINPIPLTEEILLKCGLEYDGRLFLIDMVRSVYFTRPYKESTDLVVKFLPGHILTRVKHLHQLQNLYHALTGKELEIEL